MDYSTLEGLFDFTIETVSKFSSFKIETAEGRMLSAVVECRLFGKIFPKNIDVIDDVTGKLLITIEGNNFFGTNATVKMVQDETISPVCEINVHLKGVIIFIGKVIVVQHALSDGGTICFDSPPIIQQLKATLPHQSMAFPVMFNKEKAGDLIVTRSFLGAYKCSFKTKIGQNILSNKTSGIVVLSGTLWLLRKLISTTGP